MPVLFEMRFAILLNRSLLSGPAKGNRYSPPPSTFAERRPELRFKSNRNQGYRRAECEGFGITRGWFHLVGNIKAKYGILDEDGYNFDESGFMTRLPNKGRVKPV